LSFRYVRYATFLIHVGYLGIAEVTYGM